MYKNKSGYANECTKMSAKWTYSNPVAAQSSKAYKSPNGKAPNYSQTPVGSTSMGNTTGGKKQNLFAKVNHNLYG